MREYVKIPAVIIRGGTSKGVYLMAADLPSEPELRDAVILSIFGSPDGRQINGLGGADPLTSKVAIIAPSTRENVDVDYTFGYVGIQEASVDYDGNCGNISSGVGPFAIEQGMVAASEPITTVRIYNTNTKKVIEAAVPVLGGEVVTEGDYEISGVPGSGAKIALNFINSAGSKTGKLLPTGNVVDEMTLSSGKKVRVSLVDAANPAVFVKAADIGLTGRELPTDTETSPEILRVMEDIRTTAAVMMGLAATKAEVGPAVPKMAFVSEAVDYSSITGEIVKADEVDLLARTMALAVMHKAYAVTGGICLATAALIEGTVVNEVVRPDVKKTGLVRVGHPSGVAEFVIQLKKTPTGLDLEMAGVARTARRIMEGCVYVPKSIYLEAESRY
ncbi:MAG: PrpF domain-containing protein [Negativicutes bacterium]|nr:PrpF domain-containing protein [Negativicutes bacterium]